MDNRAFAQKFQNIIICKLYKYKFQTLSQLTGDEPTITKCNFVQIIRRGATQLLKEDVSYYQLLRHK